ncbi:MAG: hydrogenase accessory protein HypB, partial [Lentisphaerae bacterium]|nr:hydrogenase accessory protein HypB [Lentisphaerota bacterium]
IENVGNLVCPSAFDLGETFKVGLVSVTEGEDKPVKYPSLFTRTPVALITKTDLLPHLDVELDAFRRSLQRVRPDIRCFALSARTGDGMPAWIEYLADLAG